MKKVGNLVYEMTAYYAGDSRRINHFLKVYSLAKTMGEEEGIEKFLQNILESAAVLHDIGIKVSEEKYNSSAGNFQEIEGPPVARKLLEKLGYADIIIERVCFLIGHHHTYHDIDGLDYQILIEADFLVNMVEDNMSMESIINFKDRIFKTKTGKKLLDRLCR